MPKKIKVSITVGNYSQIESVRKRLVHKPLKRLEMQDAIKEMGFPITPKAWSIYLDFKIFRKFGKARKTYYLISQDVYSYATLSKMAEALNKVERKVYTKSTLTIPKCKKFMEEHGWICIPIEKYIKRAIKGQRH